jgi:hypothetical protein
MKTEDMIKYALYALGAYLVWEYVISPMFATSPATAPAASPVTITTDTTGLVPGTYTTTQPGALPAAPVASTAPAPLAPQTSTLVPEVNPMDGTWLAQDPKPGTLPGMTNGGPGGVMTMAPGMVGLGKVTGRGFRK